MHSLLGSPQPFWQILFVHFGNVVRRSKNEQWDERNWKHWETEKEPKKKKYILPLRTIPAAATAHIASIVLNENADKMKRLMGFLS